MAVYLLGIDIGTSSCKVALFEPDGTVAATGGSEYPVAYPHRGWAEQDPRDWWEGACRAIREMTEENSIDPAQIAGIGVDGQSWSAIALDAAGEVLCPTPIWTDTRSREICRKAAERPGMDKIFSMCGNPVQPGYTWPKILWYREERPEVFAKISSGLMLSLGKYTKTLFPVPAIYPASTCEEAAGTGTCAGNWGFPEKCCRRSYPATRLSES